MAVGKTTVAEFSSQRPDLGFDFSQPIKSQPRIYAPELLAEIPTELEPSHAYRGGGRGRPNLNQTRAHSQCSTCKRVLRNDFFYAPTSMQKRNVLFSHCMECTQDINATAYDRRSAHAEANQSAIWQYLAPRCVQCSFDEHASAMDMHHPEGKDADITQLVAELAARPTPLNAEKLLREAQRCVPLCSNCHRMIHAKAISLHESRPNPSYRLESLLRLLVSPPR